MIKDILTIVIPCKNEGKVIEKTLHCLNNQKNILGTNVIIADCSDDKDYTMNCIMNERNKAIKIKMIKGGLPSIARNNGAKYSKTRYTLFLDADIFLEDPNTINNVLKIAYQKDIHLLTCKIRLNEDKVYNFAYRLFEIIRYSIKNKIPFALGGFMLFNTKEFNNLNGFNEEDVFAEDFHISYKTNAKHFVIAKDIVYTTSRRFKNKGIVYMAKALFSTILNRNNKEFYKNSYGYWS